MLARFFRSDAMVELKGEIADVVFESQFFQLTYRHLRDMDGEEIAFMNRDEGWVISSTGQEFSDVVLHTGE